MPESTPDHIIDFTERRADQLTEKGLDHLARQEVTPAIGTLRRAIDIRPTADNLTYLAWALSLKAEYDEAIELCKRAIELDPSFGNPYNDIGSYLIKMGQFEEAIPWLEKAKLATRYEPRHFPFINLGRVYSELGNLAQALAEFRAALTIVPGHPEVLKVIEQLEKMV